MPGVNYIYVYIYMNINNVHLYVHLYLYLYYYLYLCLYHFEVHSSLGFLMLQTMFTYNSLMFLRFHIFYTHRMDLFLHLRDTGWARRYGPGRGATRRGRSERGGELSTVSMQPFHADTFLWLRVPASDCVY